MTYDDWVGLLRRVGTTEYAPVSYVIFATYQFAAAIVVMNVVFAILLDKYLEATNEKKIHLDDLQQAIFNLRTAVIERVEKIERSLLVSRYPFFKAVEELTAIERYALQNLLSGLPAVELDAISQRRIEYLLKTHGDDLQLVLSAGIPLELQRMKEKDKDDEKP